ncbi:hypothetical protein DL764_006461 [Monosporascus ibericus]|uniref:Uncharacterized protein n=1 Tax=Monosporascus ibericus TaxID=155417 RepID=A0A4V1XA28_9PEZI|nr:hypothetical protein DL764_006461 [Monosporascus ibericus]
MLEYMSEGNSAVTAPDNEFYRAYARPSRTRECSFPYICNFLEMRSKRFGNSLSQRVNINSGTLRYAEDVLFAADHRGLNKFRSSDDPNFEKFSRPRLRQLGQEARSYFARWRRKEKKVENGVVGEGLKQRGFMAHRRLQAMPRTGQGHPFRTTAVTGDANRQRVAQKSFGERN